MNNKYLPLCRYPMLLKCKSLWSKAARFCNDKSKYLTCGVGVCAASLEWVYRAGGNGKFAGAVLLSVWVVVLERMKKTSNTTHEQEKTAIRNQYKAQLLEQAQAGLNGILGELAHKMDFCELSDGRISIFCLCESRDEFYCLERWSENPEFERHSRGERYPKKRGILWKAWSAHGVTHDAKLGNYCHQSPAWKVYVKKNYKYNEEDLEALSMPVADIAAIRINSEAMRNISKKPEFHGIIVFESTIVKIDKKALVHYYETVKNELILKLTECKKYENEFGTQTEPNETNTHRSRP